MATSRYITNIIPTVAPRLPSAPNQYDPQFIEQLSNIIRIYFNAVDTTFTGILGDTQIVANSFGAQNTNKPGMVYLASPNGQFHEDGTTTLSSGISNNSTTPISVASTTGFPSSGYILIGTELIQYTAITSTTFEGVITRGVLGTTQSSHNAGDVISAAQGVASPTTVGLVRFNGTDSSNGIAISSTDPTRIVFNYSAVYNIQVSVQLLSYDGTIDNVVVWFRQNGVDIPYTASVQSIPTIHAGKPGAAILSFNILQQVYATDYIQVAWASDTGNTVVATYPAGTNPVHPVSPGVILTATFVSRTPS